MSRLRTLRPNHDGVVDFSEMETAIKFAAAKAFPSVVGILSRRLPDDMAQFTIRGRTRRLSKNEIKERGEIVFWGSGVIIECQQDDDTTFSSIIICPATLFVRTSGIDPSDIEVDVYLWDGKICQGRVVACDFHYNLAAVRIQTACQLQTATIGYLDDVVPIKLTPVQQQQQPFLRPHSTKFNISPGPQLIAIARSFEPRNGHIVASGVFSSANLFNAKLDYDELYWVKKRNHPDHQEKEGGAVINYLGEVIGLMFYDSPFLPMNLVSTWWKHFKSCRQYHRPCLGVKIANLHSSSSAYLREILAVFPDVTGGVVVTKVAEDSPAYRSGIRPEDVIVQCDGKLVRSSLELFEILWNKVGIEYVELLVLRVRYGDTRKLRLKVEQASPDKMYRWEQTSWCVFRPTETDQ